ncbi:uncharacterized protein K460DRAFT_345093 [Cucurbitaria berberidis CBS 394.84]|uniref:Uncharacterized protein n=1 Tax=Cucurbitaria berberidis CBS 394.84 TaxID=1168544 RepID=A0A9P4G9W0_9PLEO|nr:uncharacterized protein K460DRAFT_345093 [Cucurbitaria berberidis CBS 394.84]KAF1841848.1 hypothetical protein K460DRAFT_345093 [Cucurbitaria berberidis CBS 394.84]
MAGQKRTRSGQVKPRGSVKQPQLQSQRDTTMTEPTPPCGQPQPPSTTSTDLPSTVDSVPGLKEQYLKPAQPKPTRQTSKPKPTNRKNRQKLPKLPNNAVISKRPLLHPAIPTPFASTHAPKVLYITASSPYIPALKRIRRLLSEITKREKQSTAAQSKRSGRRPPEPNGRLAPADVEREIADQAARRDGAALGRERVYLKATGRAIPRALELGVHFQGEDDCRVTVEMGSVRAIDDIEVRSGSIEDTDNHNEQVGGDKEEEDIPETRIRTLSSVTISIRLK